MTGVNVGNHDGAHIHIAVRLGKVFDLRSNTFLFFKEDNWMKIAYILFDGVNLMDFDGFYEAIALTRFLKCKEDITWDLCANKEVITDEKGSVEIRISNLSPDLSTYDLLYVPGGFSTRKLIHDNEFVQWLQTAKDVQYKISVCTGSLLLGAAGFLRDKKATTNKRAYDLLRPFCAELVEERIVKDGNVITGGGVATSIDLGLYVCEMLTDDESVERVKDAMDYPYYKVGTFS